METDKIKVNTYIRGEVTNISDHPLRGVRAIASLYDANSEFISSEDGFIRFSTLETGQTGPYVVQFDYNPRVVRFEMAFVDSDDQRLKP